VGPVSIRGVLEIILDKPSVIMVPSVTTASSIRSRYTCYL
jgi:hypothetical protein